MANTSYPPNEKPLPLEVAVFSAASALNAQGCGASRVELNAPGSYDQGGTTPPVSELAAFAGQLTIPVRIMIRPRGPPADGGIDFVYTDQEFEQMKQSIREFQASGLLNPVRGDAFVFGIVKPVPRIRASSPGEPSDEVAVDVQRCAKLTVLARPFGCVFHRAFDRIAATAQWSQGLDDLWECEFEGLLSAGGYGTYFDNIERLNEMAAKMRHRLKMQLVVGGGVRHHNVKDAAAKLAVHGDGNVFLHSAALSKKGEKPAEALDADEVLQLLDVLQLTDAD